MGSVSLCRGSFRLLSSRALPLGRGRWGVTRVFPEAKSADEGIGLVARAATLGELLQLVDVPAPEQHILGLEGGDQACNHVRDIFAPFLLAVPLQPATADIIFVGSFPVRKVPQLHGLDDTVHDHGGSETRSQA